MLMLLLSATCFSQLQIGYHYRIKTKHGINYKADSLSPVVVKKVASENSFLKAKITPDPNIIELLQPQGDEDMLAYTVSSTLSSPKVNSDVPEILKEVPYII